MTADPQTTSSRPGSGWYRAGATAGIVFLFLFLSFPEVLSGKSTWFYRDFGVLGFPTLAYLKASLLRGEWPFWNPLSHCGVPFFAQWGVMSAYPPLLVALVLPLPWGVNLFCALHLAWGAAGIHRWCEGSGLSPGASRLAGVLFVFNGLMLATLSWANYVVALAWLPWILWSVGRPINNPLKAVILPALLGAAQWLAGVPEVSAFTWGLALILPLAQRGLGSVKSLAVVWAGALILSLALVAFQILPFLELHGLSQRAEQAGPVKWPLGFEGLINLFLPLFKAFRSPQDTYFVQGQLFFGSVYLGLTAVFLALLGLLTRNVKTWLTALVLISSVWIAIGPAGGLYNVVPLVGLARYPVKFLLFGLAPLVWLAARGADRIQELDRQALTTRRASQVAVGCFILLLVVILNGVNMTWPGKDVAAFRLNWLLRIGWLALGVGVVLSARRLRSARYEFLLIPALMMVAWLDSAGLPFVGLPGAVPNEQPIGDRELLRSLANKPLTLDWRLFITPLGESIIDGGMVPSASTDHLIKRQASWSNLNLLDGVAKVNGASTLRPWWHEALSQRIYKGGATNIGNLLNFLSVKRALDPDAPGSFRTNLTAMPLITAGQTVRFAPWTNVLETVASAAFKPDAEVWLTAEAAGQIRATNRSDLKVVSQKFAANRVEASVNGTQPGMVVMAQTYYPAWEVTIDGAPVPSWLANAAFQAVEVPPGPHQIIWQYRDSRFSSGLAISAAALFVLALLWRPWRDSATHGA